MSLPDADPLRRTLNEIVDQGVLILRVAADPDADNRDVHVAPEEPRNQARMGAGAAGRDNEPIDAEVLFEQLVLDFLGAGDIAGRADRIGSAPGDDVALAPGAIELLDLPLHGGHHVRAAGDHVNLLHTQKAKEEVVSARLGIVAARDALLQDQPAFQTFLDRSRQRQPAVVGLDRAARHERVGLLFEGIGDQELELAGLVAAGGETQEVVTLDEDVGPAHRLGQTGQKFERGFSLRVAPPGKNREVHTGPSSFTWFQRLTIASISMSAFFGRAATCTVERAGRFALKYSPYTWFTAAKFPMSARKTVTFTARSRLVPAGRDG